MFLRLRSLDDDAMRVLIVRIGAMGDVVHSMPAVAALRELHPDWEIRWAVEPVWTELMQAGDFDAARGRGAGMPLVDGWYPVPTKAWKKRLLAGSTIAEIKALRHELLHERFDLCVDMQGAVRSAVVGKLARAGKLVGAAIPRESAAKWFYDEMIATPAIHVADQGCELLSGAIGEKLRAAPVPFPVNRAAESWCDGVVDGTKKLVVMAPSAGWGAKEWPAERYGAVASQLGRAGFGVVVNAVPGGDPVAEGMVAASEGFARAVPCSVGQMISLMRRAALVIGGDTGPLHLAAALERPVLAIYGPTNPERNGPFGAAPMKVLRDASSVTDHARLKSAEAGMLKIGVDEVVAAATEMLAGV
jgi:heptosyltransferase I